MFNARNGAVQSFHAGIVDYAGLFPPASLPFEISIRCFSAYLKEENPWMIARFVCPHTRFEELVSFAHLFPTGCPVSALIKVKEEADVVTLAEKVESNLAVLEGTPFQLAAMEITLPPSTPDDSLLLFVKGLEAAVDQHSIAEAPFAFFEWPLSESHLWNRSNELRDNVSNMTLGLKARCGGILPDHFPTVNNVASFLEYCLNHKTPFKCTAGLHHPVRQLDTKIGASMHGYWNIFGAAILGRIHNLGQNQLLNILSDTDPNAFGFEEDMFSHGTLSAQADEITKVRRKLAISFGSCSFDEPREDLRAAGYST